MNKNNPIVFIADAFAHQIAGGGELNNQNLIELLRQNGETVLEINSQGVVAAFIESYADSSFIVANFVGLSEHARAALLNKHYLIYEHDHKYIKSRNPADFPDYEAPADEIINSDFYKNAQKVICQSQFHEDIVKKNLKLTNIINVGGNLWAPDILEFLLALSKTTKEDKCSVMLSDNWHKNTTGAVKFCKAKNLPYELIRPAPYKQFLTSLGKNNKLVFLPQTPETLSRIVVEARMMGMSTITNQHLGAIKENWFQYKGETLVDIMKEKRVEILNIVKENLLDA